MFEPLDYSVFEQEQGATTLVLSRLDLNDSLVVTEIMKFINFGRETREVTMSIEPYFMSSFETEIRIHWNKRGEGEMMDEPYDRFAVLKQDRGKFEVTADLRAGVDIAGRQRLMDFIHKEAGERGLVVWTELDPLEDVETIHWNPVGEEDFDVHPLYS